MNCAAETSSWESVENVLQSNEVESATSERGLGENFYLLVDLELTGSDGLITLRRIRGLCPTLPIVVLIPCSASTDLEAELRHLDCAIVNKPVCSADLETLLKRPITAEIRHQSQSRERGHSDARVDVSAQETWFQRVQPLLTRVASSDIPVLLRGETGVGKEVIARQLHSRSTRRDAPFVKVNCVALPSELVESELFGYDKGAFTGAFKNTPGKFEMANGGTILLDEIGDMDLKLQAKLLQVLQDKEFYRLGATECSRVDVRVMAASHCDFERAINEKRFREDLYYRLNIVDLKIPPLRERSSEILSLCDTFLERHATPEHPKLEITPIFRQVLLEYHWPGNIRELENVMRKYLVLRNPSLVAAEIRERTVSSKSVFVPAAEGIELVFDSSDQLAAKRHNRPMAPSKPSVAMTDWLDTPVEGSGPKLVSRSTNATDSERESALRKVDEARKAAESHAILKALEATLWNRKRAALLLQIDYKALLYKMRKLGIGEKRTGSLG